MNMDGINRAEVERQAMQTACDTGKTPLERNRLGQFSTPAALASDILRHARGLTDAGTSVRFLDPSIGTGSFYTALLREFSDVQVTEAVGFEIDPHYGLPARRLWQDFPLDLRIADFTTATPPAENEKFNLLICNPPYVRHHHIDSGDKIRLRNATSASSGMRFGGLAGLYCHFIGLAHAWLAEEGIAAWLIPSEFMDVKYGEMLKTYLLNEVELIRIHRFATKDLQFADALVSSAVVWFRKRKPAAGHAVEFTYGGPHSAPTDRRIISVAELRSERKWTRFPVSAPRPVHNGLKLNDFFKIQRGLVTGDNGFFIMTAEEIEARSLPRELFNPILPSPRYVQTGEINADANGNPCLGRRLFILDCRVHEEVVRDQYPNLWSYLQSGHPGVSSRYICRSRSPWYLQENRPSAPIVCTYMGRESSTGRPIRFILNHSRATAANVYLMLYPRPVLARALAGDPGLIRRVCDLLNDIDICALLGEGRVYGGGLYKMEPNELANVPAGAIASLLPGESSQPRRAVQETLWPVDEVREPPVAPYTTALGGESPISVNPG